MLALVIRSLSSASLRPSSSAVFAVPRISRSTSRLGSVPSRASSTSAVDFSAAGMSVSASLKDSAPVCPRDISGSSRSCDGVGLEFSDVSMPSSSACRSSRESLCSEVSTWSSCTGVAVETILIESPDFISGAFGEPGLRSTKKLPSRKIRGRIFALASTCSGSAASSSSSTTFALSLPSTPSTALTLPTSTPAIRTGELGRIELADSNCALTRNPCVNGMSFVNPKYMITAAIAKPTTPMKTFERLATRRPLPAITSPSSPAAWSGRCR